MEIRITDKARRQLRLFYEQFKEYSVQKANDFIDNFYKEIEILKDFPQMYAIVPQLEKQEIRRLLYRNYKVLYNINDKKDIIYIVAFLHPNQRLQI